MPESEIKIQAACYQWAWNTHHQSRRCLFHVPNGGSRNKIEAMQLKASGVIAGIPDLLFVWGGAVHAFELKTSAGTVSDEQKKVHAAWLAQGVKVHIVRDFETFKKLFNEIVYTQPNC